MFELRTMSASDFDEVADLIYLSTNSWYQTNRGHAIFEGGPEVCRLFCQVYEALDPGCAMVAVHKQRGNIVGSAFIHPRETHISIGIVNVHPNHFGDGVAGGMMDSIIAYAEQQDLPLRLVSSAMNLDSFSLYSRKGFVPYAAFQDVLFEVPESGVKNKPDYIDSIKVQPATAADLLPMGQLEFEVSGISREQDYCYFVDNEAGIWQTVVATSTPGEIDGFLVSVDDPGSRMIGPGIAKTPEVAAAMLYHQLDRFRGRAVVALCPVDQPILVKAMYTMGGRNCEIHFGQVRGETQPVNGIVMPTFMPETA